MTKRHFYVAAMALCAAATSGWAADPYKPMVRITFDHRRFDVATDGSSVMTATNKMQLLNAGLVASMSQAPVPYSEQLQQLDITEAYTQKVDGTKIPVQPDAIITQQRPGLPNFPGANDQKQKLIIYPNVDVGDTIVSTRVLKSKPVIPGLFSAGSAFPPELPIDDSEAVYVVPKSTPLYSDSRDVKIEKTVDGDKLVYTIRSKTNPDKQVVAQYVSVTDRAPWYDVSTFKDWTQFAKAYNEVIAPKLAVTPAIQAKADQITDGVTDKREQARKIYEWVSNRIRYVALSFGIGGIVPHDPEAVLTNGYGDCKDHAILLKALLKAKGIDSDLVVINAGSGYTVPNVPVLSVFNHMISYVPSLALYIDSTHHTPSFGYLPWTEYGKTVVHFASSGNPVHKIPVLSEKDYTYHYSEQQTLDASGKLTGTGKFTGTGVAAGVVRNIALSIKSQGQEKSAADLLEKRGLHGATGAYDPAATEIRGPSFVVSGHYTAPNQQGWLNGTAFPIAKGLVVAPISDETWLGPITDDKYKSADVMPCLSVSGSEDYSLALPEGKKLVKLPSDAAISAEGLKYTTHWSQSGQIVLLHRELKTHFSEPLCRGAQRKAIGDALVKIKTDLDTQLLLQ